MEAAPRPWHPFRHPGLCGLRGTTCILTVISVMICIIILYATGAIDQTKKTNDNAVSNISAATRTHHRGRRDTLVVPVQNSVGDVVTLVEGSEVRFECNPYKENCINCRSASYGARYGQVYFCRHPCEWSDVVAYHEPTRYGTDERFTVYKKGRAGDNREGMVVRVRRVRLSDEGMYFCGIDKSGTDWQQQIYLKVGPKAPSVAGPLVEPGHLSNNHDWLVGSKEQQMGTNSVVSHAALKCQGNKACTLALMQKDELSINSSCWLCLQMSHAWKAIPLTVETLNDTKCLIPRQMSRILIAASELEKGKTPQPVKVICEPEKENKKMKMSRPLRVTHTTGDVCICSSGPRMNVGWSECRVRIDIRKDNIMNCSVTNGTRTIAFTCPFNKPNYTSAASVWVCGDRAYYVLPKDWSGCCYPALMNVGTSVYLQAEHPQNTRKKRDNVFPAGMPRVHNGYVLADPWTAPWVNVGWSIFLGGGTAAAMNKINGLAWAVLEIANSTETALGLINDELAQIRDAVIQNRLVLDMLTAEKGGVCKMLSTSCCFYIPDYSNNVTNVIDHMRMAVKEPPRIDSQWFEWFTNLWGGWGYWIGHTVLPVIVIGLLLVICLPCVIQCVSALVQRTVTNTVSYQMLLMSGYDNEMVNKYQIQDDDDETSEDYTDMN